MSDGATSSLEPVLKQNDWTSYQTVTIPAERKIYWRIPTHTPWLELDLRNYFKS